MTEAARIQWHRDADTSPLIRVCWSLGVGTLFGALALIVFGRLLGLAAQVGGQVLLLGALVATGVAVLALAVAGKPSERLATIVGYLPVVEYTPDEAADTRLKRGIDAAVGAVFVGALIVGFDMGIEGNIGEMLAAATIPLSITFLLAAVFMRSTGVLDRDEGVLFLYDPEDAIDLAQLSAVSSRTIGGSALVRLHYRTPDNEYVPGPRRLLLPKRVATELESLVG